MNRPLSTSLALIVALVLCFHLANAQQHNSTTSTQTAEVRLREKAFKLLESLADQITSLHSAENRARMGSNIAESLWTYDEKRARALFKLVEDDIKLGFRQSDDEPDERTFMVFLKLREDNVERLAKHDPEFALAFLRETLPLVQETARRPSGEVPPHIIQKEHALVLRIAKRIGPRNPDVAVHLARQALEHGLSEDLLMLLIKLSSKNREQAQVLHKEIVAKLREADFTKHWLVMRFAHQLVGHFRPPAADESTYSELISILLTKAFAHGCD